MCFVLQAGVNTLAKKHTILFYFMTVLFNLSYMHLLIFFVNVSAKNIS